MASTFVDAERSIGVSFRGLVGSDRAHFHAPALGGFIGILKITGGSVLFSTGRSVDWIESNLWSAANSF